MIKLRCANLIDAMCITTRLVNSQISFSFSKAGKVFVIELKQSDFNETQLIAGRKLIEVQRPVTYA